MNSGTVAVNSPVSPESMCVSPQAISEKGIAVLVIPRIVIRPTIVLGRLVGVLLISIHSQHIMDAKVIRNATRVSGPISAIAILIQ